MKRIIIYRHPECERCAKFARVHHLLDWLHRAEPSAATPPTGPLRMGEVVVEEIATGRVFAGAEALAKIFRQIPLYWPLQPLLRIPAVRRRVDRELSGCADGSCEVRPPARPAPFAPRHP
jgi:hypothetical protein